MALWVGAGLATLFMCAIAAWLLWRKRPTTSHVTRFLNLDSNYAAVDGIKIRYVQQGSGPTLVLLHGIGASLYIWRFIFGQAARHFRVIALDLPGFGESEKQRRANYGLDAQSERVQNLLDQLHVEKAFLVGSSMGGAIALWMAKRNPERFPKVVVLAPATHPRARMLNLSLLRHISFRAHWALNKLVMKQILKQVVSRQDLITDETIHHYLQPYLHQADGVHTFLLATQVLQDPRLPNELQYLKNPVLILYGANDRLISQAMMEKLHSILPNSQLEVHPSAGHHSMEDEPDWVMAQIKGFLNV